MRFSLKSLLFLGLCVAGCKSASSNPLIGTWTTTDHGCASKYTFTEKTMYFEDPGLPGLVPPSKGTINVAYSANAQQILVQNLSTGVTDTWTISDPSHATSDAGAQCHYVKQ